MTDIETKVRSERDQIALEAAELDHAAWREMLDRWGNEPHEQDDPREVPEQNFSDDCWDEHGQLVLVPIDLPRVSLPEAAVRLAVLHDHVFGDGRFEPICTEEWYDSLSLRLQVRVTCFRRLMDESDRDELAFLRRWLTELQEALGTGGTAKQAPPLAKREQQVLDIITAQPLRKAIKGSAIIERMREKHNHTLEQGTLTGHIIPKLKKWYGVKNRPNVGYYREQR